ncbi:MAG TPA: PsbP-related protein [Nitrososphaeraceae archaeon]
MNLNYVRKVSSIKAAITIAILDIFLFTIITLSIEYGNNDNNSMAISQLSSNDNVTINNFHARGNIGSLIVDLLAEKTTNPSNESELFVLSGNWNFDVINGTVENFHADFIMGTPNGTQIHTHSITNLTNVYMEAFPNNITSVSLNKDNGVSFSGIADINTNDTLEWRNVPLTITISEGDIIGSNIISILLNSAKTDNHFKDMPIYGLVTSLTDQNNKERRSSNILLSSEQDDDNYNITTNNYNFLTYENSNLGIKIQYPFFWVYMDLEGRIEGTFDVVLVPLSGNSSAPSSAYINVAKLPFSSQNNNITLDEFSAERIDSLKQSLPNLNIIVSNSTATLGENPAHKLVYTYSGPFDNREVKGIQVWTIDGNRIYNFKYLAGVEEFSDNLQTVLKMIDSFQILE